MNATGEAAWWTGAATAVPEWFRTFAGLERIATREFVYEPTIINGPLQTAEVRSIGYMEMIDGAVYLQDPDQVRTCSLIADQLAHTALDVDQSIELVTSLVAEIEG